MEYGKLENGQIIRATNYENGWENPTEKMLINFGFKPIITMQEDGVNYQDENSIYEYMPQSVDDRTQAEKRQEHDLMRIPTELSQAFITYRAEAVAYRLENNEALALAADAKANEKAQEIAAIKEEIRIQYPDTV